MEHHEDRAVGRQADGNRRAPVPFALPADRVADLSRDGVPQLRLLAGNAKGAFCPTFAGQEVDVPVIRTAVDELPGGDTIRQHAFAQEHLLQSRAADNPTLAE